MRHASGAVKSDTRQHTRAACMHVQAHRCPGCQWQKDQGDGVAAGEVQQGLPIAQELCARLLCASSHPGRLTSWPRKLSPEPVGGRHTTPTKLTTAMQHASSPYRTSTQCYRLPGILLMAPAMSSPWTPPRPPRPIERWPCSLSAYPRTQRRLRSDDSTKSRTYNGQDASSERRANSWHCLRRQAWGWCPAAKVSLPTSNRTFLPRTARGIVIEPGAVQSAHVSAARHQLLR